MATVSSDLCTYKRSSIVLCTYSRAQGGCNVGQQTQYQYQYYVQLRTCSIYTTCVLYVLVVDLLMYVGIHTVLLTDCHLEKNQRHTSSAATTFVPSKYLLSYSVLPIHHLIQVETTSQFFFISKSQYSIEDLFLGCCCCYSPKKLREETFLFLSRYTQAHSTMAKNSKGGRQVGFFVCLFCGFLLPCP